MLTVCYISDDNKYTWKYTWLLHSGPGCWIPSIKYATVTTRETFKENQQQNLAKH